MALANGPTRIGTLFALQDRKGIRKEEKNKNPQRKENEKEKRKPPKASKSAGLAPQFRPGHFVPADFVLTDRLLAYALKQGLTDAEARYQFESFQLWEFRDVKRNWELTWMRWCRSAAEGRYPPPSYHAPRRPTAAEEHAAKKRIWLETLQWPESLEPDRVIDITPKGEKP